MVANSVRVIMTFVDVLSCINNINQVYMSQFSGVYCILRRIKFHFLAESPDCYILVSHVVLLVCIQI